MRTLLAFLIVTLTAACGGPDTLPVEVRSGGCGPIDVWLSVDHQVLLVDARAEPIVTAETDRPTDGAVHVDLKVTVGGDDMASYFDEDVLPGEALNLLVDCNRGRPRVLHF